MMNNDNNKTGSMHKLLARQLRKHHARGAVTKELEPLINAINQAYHQADEDRALLERSLELTSAELSERYQELKRQITEISETKSRLEDSLSLLYATLDATNDGILVTDENGKPVTCNGMFEEIFGMSLSALTAQADADWAQLLRRQMDNGDEFLRIRELIRRYPGKSQECFVKLTDGRYIECCAKPRASEGLKMGAVWSFNDVTDLKENEQQALFHSYYDPLTGLPNRTLLYQRLAHAIERRRHLRIDLAVLLIDLDGFKYVNDTLSLSAGDHILKEAANRIRGCVEERGSVARYGGDEFVVLQEDVRSTMEVTLLAEKLRAVLESPFEVEGQSVHLSASVGIVTAPNDGVDPETLIRKADMAMHHAKTRGRNNSQFFAEELERLSAHRLKMRNNLKTALTNREFLLLYQPKIDLARGDIVGFEALIRWQRPDGTIVSPAEFIPEAESSGIIVEIGAWVLEEACRQMEVWHGLGFTDKSIAVNVSTQQFQQGNVLKMVEQALVDYRITPSQLELEITESLIMEDVDKAKRILQALREQGIKVAIDDFGTGYSSLNYLKNLPIDILKIDKSFIDGLSPNSGDMALVETIIRLAHQLDMRVVAEGVEDANVKQLLASYRCDYAQGYYFSRPASAEAVTRMLHEARQTSDTGK
ncbi:EAL domain-containing protein [Marinobacteraceae bacterium S3BR75-40.1]